MKLGNFITIHMNILTFVGCTGLILIIRGVWYGSVLLLISGVYGNIFGRKLSKRLMPFFATNQQNRSATNNFVKEEIVQKK